MRTTRGLMAVAVLLVAFGPLHSRAQIAVAKPVPYIPPPPSTSAMAVSPDGKLIAIGYSQRGHMMGGVELVSTKTGRGPGVLLNYSQPQMSLVPSALAFSPDGTRLAFGGNQGRVLIWDVTKTGNELIFFDAIPDPAKASSADVRAIAFGADGKSVVTITGDGFLKRWNTADGKLLSTHPLGEAQRLGAAIFSKDGKLAASMQDNDLVHVWNVETGSRAKSIQLPQGAVISAIALSPDADRLVVCIRTGPITVSSRNENLTTGATIVYDLQSGQRIRTISSVFADVQFSPSGKMLVTSDLYGPLRIWDIPSGKNVLTLSNESGYVQLVASPDRVHVIGRSSSGVSAWDVLTGERVLGR